MIKIPTLDVAINALRAEHGAKKFEAAARKIKREAKEVDKSVKKNKESFNSLGKQMKTVVVGMVGMAVAYKALRFAVSSVKEIVAFQKQLASVSTMLTDQTINLLPGFERGLEKLAVKYGQSTATLSKGLYDILSASIAAEKGLEFLEVSARTANFSRPLSKPGRRFIV